MKKLLTGIAVALTFAAAGNAWGQAINKTCPVKGTPVKGITVDFEGRTIGFC